MSFLKINNVEFADPLINLSMSKKPVIETAVNANGRTIASVVNRASTTPANLSWGSLTHDELNVLLGLADDGTAHISIDGDNRLYLINAVSYGYLYYTDDDDVLYADCVLEVTDMGY